MNAGKIGILTGGGDVPGLNSVIKTVVYRASEMGRDVTGIRRGCGPRRRARGRGRHRGGAAGAQAQEDRAQAHYRAAGGCAGRPVNVARAGRATIRRTVPVPDAERHFHALSFHFLID